MTELRYTEAATEQLWHMNSHIAEQLMDAVMDGMAGDRELQPVDGWPYQMVTMGDYRAIVASERDGEVVVVGAGHRADVFEQPEQGERTAP